MNATEVTAGLAESNGRLLLDIWRDSLQVTCGLTACTPGSAPGPTLGNEYGKTLPLPLHVQTPLTFYGITACYLQLGSRLCISGFVDDVIFAMHNRPRQGGAVCKAFTLLKVTHQVQNRCVMRTIALFF